MVDAPTESCRRSEIPAACVIDGKVAWQDLDNQDDGINAAYNDRRDLAEMVQATGIVGPSIVY